MAEENAGVSGGEEPLLSVIVPVYNAEKHLRKCLDTLVGQSYGNIELLLVDDGSTDASGRICDEYEKSHGNIRVIHKENEGIQQAKNTGLRAAGGEYIAFVDDDDFLDLDMYEVLIRNLRRYGCDVSIGGSRKCYSPNAPYKVRNENVPAARVFRGEDNIIRLLGDSSVRLSGALWNKVFRKKCVEGIFFTADGPLSNEGMFIWDVVYRKRRVKSVCCVRVPFYHYLQNYESFSHTMTPEQCVSGFQALDARIRDVRGTAFEEDLLPFFAKRYLRLSILVCRSLLACRRKDEGAYLLARKNVEKYGGYIRGLSFRDRVSAGLIRISWNAYKPWGALLIAAHRAKGFVLTRVAA